MRDSSSLEFVWDGEEFYSVSQLVKNRGWTKTLIKKFLGNPCATCPNPYYHGSAPMKLYRKGNVLDVEQLNSFVEAKAEAAQHSALARQRFFKRIEDCVCAINKIHIQSFDISIGSLIRKAKIAATAQENSNAEIFKIKNSEEIMAISLLFDLASPSMYAIDGSFGMPGVRAMREAMRVRILQSIKQNFPELGELCQQIENNVDLGTPDLNLEVLTKLH